MFHKKCTRAPPFQKKSTSDFPAPKMFFFASRLSFLRQSWFPKRAKIAILLWWTFLGPIASNCGEYDLSLYQTNHNIPATSHWCPSETKRQFRKGKKMVWWTYSRRMSIMVGIYRHVLFSPRTDFCLCFKWKIPLLADRENDKNIRLGHCGTNLKGKLFGYIVCPTIDKRLTSYSSLRGGY